MRCESKSLTIVGVDTGGTFTDLVMWDAETGRIVTSKLLSTPDDPARALTQGLARIAGEATVPVVHGSTVATNALLEGKGARTAFVANEGFTDILEIGRQNRPKLYDLAFRGRRELIPRELRFGAPGRIDAKGNQVASLTPDEARRIARAVAASGARSAAVCLLYSFLDNRHEVMLAEALMAEGVAVSASHEILAEFREFERASTTAINAYVAPVMRGYLGRIRESLGPDRAFRIMQSNGGTISSQTAMREAVRTILSGPAGGAAAALALGRKAGFDKLIAFDMGGTSTDVCLLNGRLPLTTSSEIAGLPVVTPAIGIHTVGAGGGSIARLDAGGALTVGPDSAGADPGPACYGRGEHVTVTDANLALSRLDPEYFLGGTMPLYPERAASRIAAMADRAGLDPPGLAEGIVAVANASMERAIRRISVARGFNPAEFALYCFGGAGGLHAAYLARALSMATVVAPPHAGLLSALGMLLADIVKDYSRTVMLPGDAATLTRLDDLFAPLEAKAASDMASECAGSESVVLTRFLDMRYRGQSFELLTPGGDDPVAAFHELHEKTYGYRDPSKPVEVATIRLRATAATSKPVFAPLPLRGVTPSPDARIKTVSAVFDGKTEQTPVFERDRLAPGNRIAGPAIVAEYSATTLIPPFAKARVDALGNLIIEITVSASRP